MDFIIVPNNNVEELLIYDYSTDNTVEEEYNSWYLKITSSVIDNSVTLDIIDYLHNHREVNELYKIIPSTLNFTEETFKDGLYEYTMTRNTNSVKTHYIISYTNINNRFKDLLEKYNYTFTISGVGYISYIDDCDNGGDTIRTENIRILSGLIDQLQTYSFEVYSEKVETEIYDILDKALRIAEILEN